MGLNIARFLSLLFTALVLAPAMAHLLELPNKIGLSRDEYLVVQQIYNGWQLLGIVIYGALLSTLALAILVRRQPKAFSLTLAAFLCLLAAHALFWIYTFPANRETLYWTVLPENWMALRAQWEYSHAAGAVLNLVAFILLVLSVQLKEPE
ncbi:MAG: DUF1772 domain-containing protein [Pseudomonadota bacterium]